MAKVRERELIFRAFISVILKSGQLQEIVVAADIRLSLEQKMDRYMHTCIIHVCTEPGRPHTYRNTMERVICLVGMD